MSSGRGLAASHAEPWRLGSYGQMEQMDTYDRRRLVDRDLGRTHRQ